MKELSGRASTIVQLSMSVVPDPEQRLVGLQKREYQRRCDFSNTTRITNTPLLSIQHTLSDLSLLDALLSRQRSSRPQIINPSLPATQPSAGPRISDLERGSITSVHVRLGTVTCGLGTVHVRHVHCYSLVKERPPRQRRAAIDAGARTLIYYHWRCAAGRAPGAHRRRANRARPAKIED